MKGNLTRAAEKDALSRGQAEPSPFAQDTRLWPSLVNGIRPRASTRTHHHYQADEKPRPPLSVGAAVCTHLTYLGDQNRCEAGQVRRVHCSPAWASRNAFRPRTRCARCGCWSIRCRLQWRTSSMRSTHAGATRRCRPGATAQGAAAADPVLDSLAATAGRESRLQPAASLLRRARHQRRDRESLDLHADPGRDTTLPAALRFLRLAVPTACRFFAPCRGRHPVAGQD